MRKGLILLALLMLVPLAMIHAQEEVNPVAQQALDLLLAEDFEAVDAMFNEQMGAALDAGRLAEVWTAMKRQVGEYQETTDIRVDPDTGAAIFTLQFERLAVEAILNVDEEGKLSGLFLRPAQAAETPEFAPPPYADTGAFTEQDVTIGEGDLALPGTLSIPNGDGPFPAVVLIGGSGPTDRDSTIGPNKPLRDLAWGLASQGVAVLRYAERSVAHAQTLDLTGFTLNDEIVDDAALAVELLRETEGIDPERVFVLGHSLGGYAAPRIAEAAPDVAGLILLAPLAAGVQDKLLVQTEYLLNLDGTVTDEESTALDEIRTVVDQINALTEEDADSTDMIFGAPPSYWLDLRGYDPVEAAAALDVPMLILNGERDYQVTVEDDFARWQAGLADRDDVVFQTYPGLNHLFMEGEGAPNPDEYNTPGHIREDVIDEIATWVKGI
jgi:uncharacterized protein